jgi:protein-disulfide isomerase
MRSVTEVNPLSITRRELLAGAAALALTLAMSADPGSIALAQTVSSEELMQPGPLGEQALGADNAPVTIVEYASMTCPHCANFHEKTLPELKKRYVDTGKVRFIFREFPFDPLAAGAFMLARCADKDKYFPMIDTLFAQQSKWAVPKPIAPLLAIAKQAGFTQATFEACLANQKVLEGIEWVRNRGSEKFGVDSTPTFFINGTKFKGALSIDEMAKAIDPYLKS